MSIRIVSKESLDSERGKSTTADIIPPLLFANLKSLYPRRAERLRTLAEESPFKDYLLFAAQIVEAQQHALHDHPLQVDGSALLARGQVQGKPPLDIHTLARDSHWHTLLAALIAELRPQVNEQILAVLDNLDKCAASELEAMADHLLRCEFEQVSAEKAPFIWAALSLYWAQMATQLPGKARAEYGEHRQFCPVCGSMPVSGMIQIGSTQGLRYLHCNLCESEWHVVRVKCSNCEETGKLNSWSLDSEHAAIRAESCGDCGTYLKLLYQEKDPHLDAVADDLASLALDARLEEEDFARSSVNPFLFPSGQ